MPRIVARGFKKEDLKKVSAELFDTIAEIIERPREAFTLDLVESVAILDGEEISRANLEIGWVHRPVEVCEKSLLLLMNFQTSWLWNSNDFI